MGDIRYHKGHANEAVQTYKGKRIKVSMAPNPSHLESVNPVVGGAGACATISCRG